MWLHIHNLIGSSEQLCKVRFKNEKQAPGLGEKVKPETSEAMDSPRTGDSWCSEGDCGMRKGHLQNQGDSRTSTTEKR